VYCAILFSIILLRSCSLGISLQLLSAAPVILFGSVAAVSRFAAMERGDLFGLPESDPTTGRRACLASRNFEVVVAHNAGCAVRGHISCQKYRCFVVRPKWLELL